MNLTRRSFIQALAAIGIAPEVMARMSEVAEGAPQTPVPRTPEVKHLLHIPPDCPIHYMVEVVSGGELQCEMGLLSAGITLGSIRYVSKAQSVSRTTSGTLEAGWTFKYIDHEGVCLEPNIVSSLTPNYGYPRVSYYASGWPTIKKTGY